MEQKTWYENIQSFLRKAADSTKANMVMTAIGILLIAVIIFQAGVLVGLRKGRFVRTWNDNYHPSMPTRPLSQAPTRDFGKPLPVAHGTSGKVLSVTLPTFVVQDTDGTEKSVLIHEETLIRKGRDIALPSDIATENFVVVIGTPTDQGAIRANFIRLMPPNERAPF